MDLLDTLLSQKLFIVSLSLPGVLLLVAIVLAILPRIRKSAQRAKAQKQAKAAARQEERVQKQTRRTAAKREAPAARARSAREEKQAAKAESAALEEVEEAYLETEAEADIEVEAEGEETLEPEPAAKPGEMVPSEMQEILSSVFEDEDLMHRYDVLLRGLKDVDIYELLAMSRSVSERLQQGKHVS